MNINKLDEYYALKMAAKELQEKERALRIEILEELFPSASEGTFNEHVGHFKVKGEFRNNVKVDIQTYHDNEEFLTEEEKACLSWKPSFLKGKFNDLTEENTSGFFEDMLTFTPALPSLTLELASNEDDI